MKLKAYQIYYDDAHSKHLLEGFERHYNQTSTVFLESGIMCDLIDPHVNNCDWFGVFSWKVQTKLPGINYNGLVDIIEKNSDNDILGPHVLVRHPSLPFKHESLFCYINKKQNYYKDIKKTFNVLIELLQGMKLVSQDCNFLNEQMNQIYYNAFVAKSHIYKNFVDTILRPSIELFKTNDELQRLSMKDAGYPFSPPARFTQHTGYTHYPQTPFILERLINLYIYNNKSIKVDYKL